MVTTDQQVTVGRCGASVDFECKGSDFKFDAKINWEPVKIAERDNFEYDAVWRDRY